jgi:hypothetical protein
MALGRRGERDQHGRFVEKQSPLARRVEVWLEPDLIELIDRHCAPLKEGRGRLMQRLLQQLLKAEMPADQFAPGRPLVRVSAEGLERDTHVLTADQAGRLLTCGPEAWLEWHHLEGWNVLLRQDPLELAGASLEDLVAVAEPALMSAGFDLQVPEVAAVLAACAAALAEEQALLSAESVDDDFEFVPWDGTPQAGKVTG